MNHYEPYPTYKDSGAEWLGSIPKHWKVKKLKWLASLQSGDLITGDSIGDEAAYPVFGGNGIRGNTAAFTHEGRYVLIGRQGALCGNINYSHGKFWASEHAVVVSPTEPVSTTWLGELLSTMNLNQYSVSAAQPGLAVERISDLYVPVPPFDEQEKIAKLLDREVTRIDTLVAEKTDFIDLLREKRQALITHAVTKGLDPTIPMKHSGIRWLEEVPAHWEVKPFRRIVKRIEQGWSPNAASEPCEIGGWGVLKLSAIKQGEFFARENKTLFVETDPDQSIEVKVGDLLVTRANTPQLVGDSCVVNDLNGCRLMLSDLVYRIRLNSPHQATYFCNVLISSYGRSQIEADARGSSMTMAKISQEHIKTWIVPVPPLDEQKAITDFLNNRTAHIDTLIRKTERSIELLKERRSALITGAVTGQIDLRGLE